MNKYKIIYFMICVSIISFALITNYMWVKADNSVNGVDSSNHLFFSIEFFYRFTDIIYAQTLSLWQKVAAYVDLLGSPVRGSTVYWPNGLNATTAFSYLLFGRSLFSAKVSMFPYLIILLSSTYLIGKKISGDFSGVLSAFILFMYPLIFESSRQFQLDLPLAAMVSLVIYFFLQSDHFQRRPYSILLGIALGWAMLIKGQAILFVLCPMLLMIMKGMSKKRWGVFTNIFLVLILAGMIASIWWYGQVGLARLSLMEHVFSARKALEAQLPMGKKYSIEGISFYIFQLPSVLSFPFSIALAVSLAAIIKGKCNHKGLLLSWCIPPFLFFSFVITIKHSRFIMPVLPAFAIITASAIGQIRIKVLRGIISVVIVVFALVQFYVLSLFAWDKRDVRLGPIGIFGRLAYGSDYESFPPHFNDIKLDQVAHIIEKSSDIRKTVDIISIGSGGVPSSFETLYWLCLNNPHFSLTDFIEMYRDAFINFNSADFIVFDMPDGIAAKWPTKDELIRILKAGHENKIRQLEQTDSRPWEGLLSCVEAAQNNFILIGQVHRSMNKTYYIYKRIRAA
ncbi:MAG: glycosyltransferase family 39 protein [Candidatus Omnitrophica bacterium]|nr:glycosyltransferase family 39 protein [Candidatus Omnitrophota bacterium]